MNVLTKRQQELFDALYDDDDWTIIAMARAFIAKNKNDAEELANMIWYELKPEETVPWLDKEE